jgi:hypothetical protein
MKNDVLQLNLKGNSLCCLLTKIIFQFGNSTIAPEQTEAGKECKIINIIDNWAKDVNNATVLTREAMLTYVTTEHVNQRNVKCSRGKCGNFMCTFENCAFQFRTCKNCLQMQKKNTKYAS